MDTDGPKCYPYGRNAAVHLEMNRKSFYLLLIALGLSIFSSGLGAHSSPAATIDKVITQTGKVNTRIILETDSAPALVRTYYADKTIVVELGQVNLTTPLPVEEAAGPLVKGIQLEKTGPEQARLQVQIQELIPYTVVSSAKRTESSQAERFVARSYETLVRSAVLLIRQVIAFLRLTTP